MKKILSLLLVLALALSTMLAFTACDDAKGAFEELDAEEWEAALHEDNFENVTVRYEYYLESNLQKQVMKVTDEGVYRSIEYYDKETNKLLNEDAHFFTGAAADIQRNLFLSTFLGIVKDRENFVFDKESKTYTADDVEIRIDQAEGVYVTEKVKDGKLTFSADGNVEKFVCNLTEAMYVNGEEMQSTTVDVTWTFADYGKTEFTAEEKEASSLTMGG